MPPSLRHWDFWMFWAGRVFSYDSGGSGGMMSIQRCSVPLLNEVYNLVRSLLTDNIRKGGGDAVNVGVVPWKVPDQEWQCQGVVCLPVRKPLVVFGSSRDHKERACCCWMLNPFLFLRTPGSQGLRLARRTSSFLDMVVETHWKQMNALVPRFIFQSRKLCCFEMHCFGCPWALSGIERLFKL